MRYETMGRTNAQRLNVPQLLGGLNVAAHPTLIEDDELADVCNLTPRNGMLVTRQAVRAVGDVPLVACEGQERLVDKILRQPIEIDGEMCTVIVSAAGTVDVAAVDVTVQVVTLDGVCKRTYTMRSLGGGGYSFAVVPCDGVAYGAPFLLYHAGNVYTPDDASETMTRIEADKLYAPLVMVNATSVPLTENQVPSCDLANGVTYEGFNALTEWYRARFTSSVEALTPQAEVYVLPTKLYPSTLTMDMLTEKGKTTVKMTVGGEAVGFTIGASQYSAQAYVNGYVRVSPALPVAERKGNVTITCERERGQRLQSVRDATIATWFGGTQNKRGGTRLFLAGFGSAKVMWSEVDNPFYFPENNYMAVGDLSQRVTALEKQGNMLVIFKEREMFYTTYVKGEIESTRIESGTNADTTATKAYFPLTQLSPSIGCCCPESLALCRDRLVWMDWDARLYALIPSGAYSSRNVHEIGAKIRPWLLENTSETTRKAAVAVDHDGKYRVMIGNVMAEFDYNENGFVTVSGYASGARSAQNAAWYVHRFDGFPATATQTLVSDRADRAIMISTGEVYPTHKLVRTVYRFEDGDADRCLVFDNTITPLQVSCSIAVTLTTKEFDFGDATVYKRVGALFVRMQTDNAAVRVLYNGILPPSGQGCYSRDLHAHVILPGVKRCRTAALRADAVGRLCFAGLWWQYTPFGTVK